MKLYNKGLSYIEKKKREKEEKINNQRKIKEKAFLEAIKNNDAYAIEEHIKKGINVNCKVKSEKIAYKDVYITPLVYAVTFAYSEVVKWLIESGADVNQKSDEWTPLAIAASQGEESKMKLLIDNGADINDSVLLGFTPLIVAIKNINAKGDDLKIKRGINFLIDSGADINIQDDFGDSALMVASARGYADIVKLLINAGADMNLTSYEGFLYDSAGEYPAEYTALMYAAAYDCRDVVKELIDAGVDLNQTNNYGWSALFLACMYGRKEVAKMLIDAGAEVDLYDNNSLTALMYVASQVSRLTEKAMKDSGLNVNLNVYKEITEILIKAGADVNMQSKYGTTALHSAVIGMKDDDEEINQIMEDIITLLVDAGSDPYIKDAKGNNCFAYLADSKKTNLLVKE